MYINKLFRGLGETLNYDVQLIHHNQSIINYLYIHKRAQGMNKRLHTKTDLCSMRHLNQEDFIANGFWSDVII